MINRIMIGSSFSWGARPLPYRDAFLSRHRGVVSPPELSRQDDAAQGEQPAQDALRCGRSAVVVGQGTRLFPDTGPDRALELVESRATPRGVTIQVYRPGGRLQFGTSTADLGHIG